MTAQPASLFDTAEPLAGFRYVLHQEFDIEPALVLPETRFQEDLGLDSIELIALRLAIEERFAVDMSDEEIADVRSVADAIAILQTKIVSQT